MKTWLFRNRYYVAGSALIGAAVACFMKHGAMEYAADHVWEEADRHVQQVEKDKLN